MTYSESDLKQRSYTEYEKWVLNPFHPIFQGEDALKYTDVQGFLLVIDPVVILFGLFLSIIPREFGNTWIT